MATTWRWRGCLSIDNPPIVLRESRKAHPHPRRVNLNLMVPISLFDELSETIIKSTGTLDLASGEIRAVEYEDHDLEADGLPADSEDYEFTSGMLSYKGKEIEFRVDVDPLSGKYSVTPSELLELKGRAAKLFTAPPGA